MIHEEYTISLDSSREENILRGTTAFPCAAYQGNVQNFVSGQIIPHWHHDIECFFLLSGRLRVSFIDQEYELGPGDGYLANSNVLHGISCQTTAPCMYRSIVFSPSIISGAPGSVFENAYMRPFMETGKSTWLFSRAAEKGVDVWELFSQAYDAFEKEAHGYEFIVRHTLSQMILRLESNSGFIKRQAIVQDHRVKQMLSWLDQHYAERITIEQIAENAGVSVRECQRIFAATLHDSPTRYLLRRRISAAAELLTSTNTPVSEIGFCCGIDSSSYFSKQFKAMTGMTPREYRAKHGGR